MEYRKGMDDPRYRPLRCAPKDGMRIVKAGAMVLVMDAGGVRHKLRSVERRGRG